jgi:hypothetical protein
LILSTDPMATKIIRKSRQSRWLRKSTYQRDDISGTRMSDLQGLDRRASRALISFAPSILDKMASSECPQYMELRI